MSRLDDNVFEKLPGEVLDFQWDFSSLLNSGETITGASVGAPDGISVADVEYTDSLVTAWIGGGTVRSAYEVTCLVTTSQGRTLGGKVVFVIV